MTNQKFVSWGDARHVCQKSPEVAELFEGSHFNNRVDPKRIAGVFSAVLEGADALLVNSSGRYGSTKVQSMHTAFLQANSFEVVPEANPPKG